MVYSIVLCHTLIYFMRNAYVGRECNNLHTKLTNSLYRLPWFYFSNLLHIGLSYFLSNLTFNSEKEGQFLIITVH